MDTFQDFYWCENNFAIWLLSIKTNLQVTGELVQTRIEGIREISALEDFLDKHMAALGWTAVMLPIANDFLQQAEALASEAIMTKTGIGAPSLIKIAVKGKIHAFSRTVMALDRLNATITHRIEALRTLLSLGKERFRAEMFSGSNKT